jgi:hypothetical protein
VFARAILAGDMVDDHRERRVADSAKLQTLISDLAKVPPSSRMYSIHDALMHAVDRSLATHPGHRFQADEINVIKDVAFEIVYILDPQNRAPTRFVPKVWAEFKSLSAIGKVSAVVAILVFLGGATVGAVELAEKSYSLYERAFKSEAPSSTPATAISTEAPKAPTIGQPTASPPAPPPKSTH